MRSIRSGLLRALFAGALGAGAVVGCSATGATEDVEVPEAPADEADARGGTTLPPSNPSEDEEEEEEVGAPDAGKKPEAGANDAGKEAAADAAPDAPKDAGPLSPEPGDPCTTIDQIFDRTCGKCGKQQAICRANDAGTGGTVSNYGLCQNEIGQCTPGETGACGNCGTRTCNSSCNWGTCNGQPPSSCSPGTTQYSSATCTEPNTFIKQICGEDCQFGAFTTTCESPQLTVSAVVGEVASGTWALASTQTAKRADWGFDTVTPCPASYVSSSVTPYFAVPVTNPTNQSATVQIYNSGASPLDTILAVYPGTALPADDTELKACLKAADDCEALDDLCGNIASGGYAFEWAGVDDIVIPAGQTVMVITSGFFTTTVGDFTLNVKTKSLD